MNATVTRLATKRLAIAGSAAGLLAVAATGAGPAASAATSAGVVCGQVITQSTTLQGDLGPCPGDGIIIGANRITLDLGGHSIVGAGTRNSSVGVRLQRNSGVTVMNGTVTLFSAGVSIHHGTNNVVSGITARDNIGVAAGNFGDGIAIQDSTNNIISGNRSIHNGPFDGIGVFGALATGNIITANLVQGNNIPSRNSSGVPVLNQDFGIRLEPFTGSNTVAGNTVSGSGLDGIGVFFHAQANTVLGNTLKGNGFTGLDPIIQRTGDGIRVFFLADSTVVSGNQVHGSAANGIRVDSKKDRIAGNVATGNNAANDTTRPAWDLFDTNATHPCDDNMWSGNVAGTAAPSCTLDHPGLIAVAPGGGSVTPPSASTPRANGITGG